MTTRQALLSDIPQLKQPALISWSHFEDELTADNWQKLLHTLHSNETYEQLVNQSHSIICEDSHQSIIGMAFLVPGGNPTEIYPEDWSYIRFVTVHPAFAGKGIGKQLTAACIQIARENNEKIVALHTSEFMTNARHIYESLGFSVLKELEPRLGKRYWLYTLDISDEPVSTWNTHPTV